MTAALDVPAARINPVAKLLAAFTLAVGLVLSVDWVSASTALALELMLLAVLRIPLRALLRRGAILVVAAAMTALTIALYGRARRRGALALPADHRQRRIPDTGACHLPAGAGHRDAGGVPVPRHRPDRARRRARDRCCGCRPGSSSAHWPGCG